MNLKKYTAGDRFCLSKHTLGFFDLYISERDHIDDFCEVTHLGPRELTSALQIDARRDQKNISRKREGTSNEGTCEEVGTAKDATGFLH